MSIIFHDGKSDVITQFEPLNFTIKEMTVESWQGEDKVKLSYDN